MKRFKYFKALLVVPLLSLCLSVAACGGGKNPAEVAGESVTPEIWKSAFSYVLDGLALSDEAVSFSVKAEETYLKKGKSIACNLQVNGNAIYLEETTGESTLYLYADEQDGIKTQFTSEDSKEWKSKRGHDNSVSDVWKSLTQYATRVSTSMLPYNEESGMYESIVTDMLISANVKIKFKNEKIVYATVQSEYLDAKYSFTDYGKTKISQSRPVVQKTKLEEAYDAVYAVYGNSMYYKMGEDNSYISVDTNPVDSKNFYSAEAIEIVKMLNEELGLPGYVYQAMIQTTALQGKQTASANGITATWTYHPNNGLEIMYFAG